MNLGLLAEALEDAHRNLTRVDARSLIKRIRTIYRMLVDGITVEYRRKYGYPTDLQEKATLTVLEQAGCCPSCG